MDKWVAPALPVRWLVDWTRQGRGRQMFAWVSHHSEAVRTVLLRLDMVAVFRTGRVPGRYVIVWMSEWSSELMSNILSEKIRRAPRPVQVSDYMLCAGQAKWTGVAEDPCLEQDIRVFLEKSAAERQVTLLLRGEFYAVTLRQNHWVAREGKRGRG